MPVNYTEDGYAVKKYDSGAIVRLLVTDQPSEPMSEQQSIEEEILFETKYQTMILEMGGMM